MFVKICGMTDVDDALLAVALGADAVGFVFAPSKRQIAPARARDIVARLPPETLSVGVFRNEARERVVDIANTNRLGAVQLHGDESIEDTKWIAARVPHVIKAVAAGSYQASIAAEFEAAAILLDAPSPGSGEVFDWQMADTMPLGLRLILAGGLTPDNVVEGIKRVKPFGVDDASGVELTPGRKDPTAMRRFIEAAKSAIEPDELDASDEQFYNWEVEPL